ncbi:hypothetical protein HBN76_04390 [Pseudomonas sp. WS 5013]|uniref:hypothetical protein n=1 Tax=Pseudomonas sp. WS 5013 TaxID=2717475 RepID=UPI0014766317|nr:hypothetical protein [Pseudomonas sp. WS 5013]NMY40536.1 hypothetical protein [Pseudomonas sp. WS 5013]
MSNIDVDGGDNRVAGRDFQETTITHSSIIGTQLNIGAMPDREPLTVEQRKRLNLLVANISKEYKADAWTLWKEVVHTRIGVKNIDEILRSQFAEAEQLLLEHAEYLHAQAHAKRLVAEVLDIANQRGLYQELTRFCSREFGSTILNKLSPDQLKTALRFVEERSQPKEPAQHTAAAPVVTDWWAQMVELWQQKPSQAAVLVVVSAIVGRLFLG